MYKITKKYQNYEIRCEQTPDMMFFNYEIYKGNDKVFSKSNEISDLDYAIEDAIKEIKKGKI